MNENNEIGIILLGQKIAVEEATRRADLLLVENSEPESDDSDLEELLKNASASQNEISEKQVQALLADIGYTPQKLEAKTETQIEAHLSYDWGDVVARYRDSLRSRGVETETLASDAAMSEADKLDFQREWRSLLIEIDETQRQVQIDNLFSSIKYSILAAVIRPFGLGAVLKHMDRLGGPVTTAQNLQDARQGGKFEGRSAEEFANPEAIERQRSKYEPSNYRNESPAYRESRERLKETREGNVDAYTGKPLDPSYRDLDHVVSAKESHFDPKLNLHFSHDEKVAITNARENLVFTDSGVNRSKGEHSIEDFVERNSANKKFALDEERARKVDHNVRSKRADAITPREQEYYLKNATKAVAQGALTLGLREALGLLLAELLIALFDEARDVFHNGVTSGTSASGVVPALQVRLKRVSDRVVKQKDAAWTAFKDGAFAGAISSLVTIAINTVVTTSKRVVRIIREGLLSLLRAVKMLVFPPAGISAEKAAHEASKIVAGAVIVGVGVAAQEPLSKAVAGIPILLPFADPLVEVLMGIVVGVVSGIVVYGIDQLDIFGAMKSAREDEKTAQLLASVDSELDLLSLRLEQMSLELI